MKKLLLTCFVLLFGFYTWAQERLIAGKITAMEDGSALPGVNVILKGTTTGTNSNADGAYSLSIPPSGGILIFSFIGLKSQELEIGERTTLDVQMVFDAQELTEVVVTALGIEKSRDALGYSLQS